LEGGDGLKKIMVLFLFTLFLAACSEAILMKEETEEGHDWYIKWNSTYIFPQLKEGQKVRVASSEPVRGEILDRNGVPLAQNGKVYEVGIEPGNLGDQREFTITQLATLL
jgi:hypothetical protein